MELNLDDEYYQKYIKYKERYIMLKQLKNNMELEGGEQKWLKDYYFYKNPEEENLEPQNEIETFLVFNNEYTTYDELKMFSKLVFKSVDNTVIKKGENRDDPNEQNIQEDDDKKMLMTLEEFYKQFIYGYVVEKNGNEYKYKLYDKEITNTEYKYEKIEEYLKNLRKNYILEHFSDKRPDNENDQKIYDLIDRQIRKFNEENITFFETNIETKIQSEIKDSTLMKTILEYSYQKLTNFNDNILDSTNNTLFLNKINEEVKRKEKPLNMLIKIDINQLETFKNISYIESEANNTSTYLNIQTIINDYRKAKKAKDDSKLPVKTG
jgi:hypothetical protein